MGEQVYSVGGIHISFSEAGEDYSCLCAAFSTGIDAEIVRSLALLGSAVVLAHQEEDSGYRYLPSYVPLEIREGIDEVIYAPLDDLSRIADIVRKIHTPYPLDAERKKHILKLLRRWASSRTEEEEMNEQAWRETYTHPEGIAVCHSPQWLLNGCPKCDCKTWQVTHDCWAYCDGCRKGIPTYYSFTHLTLANLDENGCVCAFCHGTGKTKNGEPCEDCR